MTLVYEKSRIKYPKGTFIFVNAKNSDLHGKIGIIQDHLKSRPPFSPNIVIIVRFEEGLYHLFEHEIMIVSEVLNDLREY